VVTRDAGIDEGLRAELAAVAESTGCELVHVEHVGGVLRLMIDRAEGGVSHEHCSNVARQAGALLDVVDFGSGRYTLEVTSPGLDRPLFTPEDYERFAGKLARITIQPPAGRKKTVVARLGGLNGDRTAVRATDEAKDEEMQIPLADIHKARLEIEL
jgi:ribosome maturation factor RimP